MQMIKEKHTQFCIEMDEGFGWDYRCSSTSYEDAIALLHSCEQNEAKYPCRLIKKRFTIRRLIP